MKQEKNNAILKDKLLCRRVFSWLASLLGNWTTNSKSTTNPEANRRKLTLIKPMWLLAVTSFLYISYVWISLLDPSLGEKTSDSVWANVASWLIIWTFSGFLLFIYVLWWIRLEKMSASKVKMRDRKMKNQPASVQYSSPSASAGSSSQNGRQEAKDSGIDTAHSLSRVGTAAAWSAHGGRPLSPAFTVCFFP